VGKGFAKISKLLINSTPKTLNTHVCVKGNKVAYLIFAFLEPCIVIYICMCVCGGGGYGGERERMPNKKHTFSHYFTPIKLSATCFEQINVHNQEVISVHGAYSIVLCVYGVASR